MEPLILSGSQKCACAMNRQSDFGSGIGSVCGDCPADFDGDCDVGITDFLQLLAEWGLIGAPCDVNGGGVGITDFLELLATWGPCP